MFPCSPSSFKTIGKESHDTDPSGKTTAGTVESGLIFLNHSSFC